MKKPLAGASGHRRSVRSTRGALALLAAILAASALVRFGEGVGHAMAGSEEAVAAPPAAGGEAQCAEDALAMLASLREREQRIIQREADLDRREAAVAEARGQTESLLASLTEKEAELARTLTIADEAAEADITRLVAVYESMKPKDAAPLFAVMDPRFAAGFLGRMRPEASAAVLAGLEPQKAYEISAELAGRNADAPKD